MLNVEHDRKQRAAVQMITTSFSEMLYSVKANSVGNTADAQVAILNENELQDLRTKISSSCSSDEWRGKQSRNYPWEWEVRNSAEVVNLRLSSHM